MKISDLKSSCCNTPVYIVGVDVQKWSCVRCRNYCEAWYYRYCDCDCGNCNGCLGDIDKIEGG